MSGAAWVTVCVALALLLALFITSRIFAAATSAINARQKPPFTVHVGERVTVQNTVTGVVVRIGKLSTGRTFVVVQPDPRRGESIQPPPIYLDWDDETTTRGDE